VAGHYYEAFAGSGFADYGLTIDGAFALAATGGNDAALTKIADWIGALGKDGAGRTIDDWTGIGTPYASGGAIAKEALLAEVVKLDPRAFAGQNLVTALDATICTATSTAPDTSCVAAGTYLYSPSVFSQALGVIAQLRAGDSANAAAPTAYLEGLQASDGSFPSLLPPTGDKDVDSTAAAVMALALVPGPDAATAVAKGVAWIASVQLPDGGFPGTAGDSTNSTGLATQALTLDAGSHAAGIAVALAFLAGVQNSDGGFLVAAGGQPGSDVRATSQAVGGAVGTSLGTLARDLLATPTTSPSASATASPSATQAGDPGPSTGGAPADALAQTGSDAGWPAAAAGLLLIVGAALMGAARRARLRSDHRRH
jgi:LPXTG-motif cell wall-anchored protein